MGEAHDTESAAGTESRRGWLVWATVALVPALLAAGLVYARSDTDEAVSRPEDRVPELISYPADLTIPTTGMVVSLDRPGRELPVSVGSTRTVYVSVTGSTDLERVELWDGEDVAATTDVDDGLRTALQRMEWTATSVGAKVLTARAYDVDGRVSMSNPVWVDVDERVEVADGVLDLTDPQSVATYVPEPAEVDQDPDSESTDRPVQGIRSFPAQAEPMTAQQIDVTVENCVVEVTNNDPDADKTVLALSPEIARTVAPIGTISGGETMRFEPGFGTFSLTGVVVTDRAVSYTAPTVFGTNEDCAVPGWTGDLEVMGGRVRIPGSAAGAAYLYVEVAPGDWERVPESGFVPLAGDHYDFSKYLPPLHAGAALEAWGWGADGLALLGSGTYTPPDPLATVDEHRPDFTSIGELVAPPLLQWEYPQWDPKYPALPEGSDNLFTSGEVIPPSGGREFALRLWGTHRFHLGNVGAASHLLVQVSSTPFGSPDDWSVDAHGFRCVIAPVDQFSIDFTIQGCTSQIDTELPESAPNVFDETFDATSGVSYDDIVPTGVQTWVDQMVDPPDSSPADPISLGKDITEGRVGVTESSPKSNSYRRYIRVVPFFGDQNFGMASNAVDLRFDFSPPAPPGVPAYELDLDLVRQPAAPDLRYMHCWQFMGWKDEAEKQQLLNQAFVDDLIGDPDAPATQEYWRAQSAKLWNAVLIDSFGSGPICAGCYRFGPTKIAFGGAECPKSTDFLTDPLGWTYENLIKWAVDLLAKGYNALGDVVDFVQTAYQAIRDTVTAPLKNLCSADSEFCDVVNAVVDYAVDRAFSIADDAVALIELPNIDDLDALYADLKAKAIAGVVLFAQSIGIPCKEYEEAMATVSDVKSTTDETELADADEYQKVADAFDKVPKSCEEMIEAVWNTVEDQVKKAVEDALTDSAQASGFGLPDFLLFRPYPAGQPGSAVVDVTVNPTVYTADRDGVTCPATMHTWAEDNSTGAVKGTSSKVIVSPYGVVKPWREQAFEHEEFVLPVLAVAGVGLGGDGTYADATTAVSLGSVHLKDLIPFHVGVLHQYGVSWNADPWRLSPYALLFRGTFTIRVDATCAGWVEQTYQLTDGGPPKLLEEVRS